MAIPDRAIREDEITELENQGCYAENWSGITVGDGFDTTRVRDVRFVGNVRIGELRRDVQAEGGIELPAEIIGATIAHCWIGDNVRIRHVGGHLANCRIEDGAIVEHVGTIATRPGATFGAGVEIAAVNEAGGRQVRMFGAMSSQFAYLMCMHRGRPALIAALNKIIDHEIARARGDMGTIGRGARVIGVSEMVDVNVGPHAAIIGAGSLRNGTILSEEQAPAHVGGSVVATDFMIGEGSHVESGAILERVFIGQAVQIGRNFSAQDSLFFANCEMFHGEACSIFAGPFTVSHHKNTLLIAGIYSFFNAGSGTNFSNHMYKLGPVHQGVCLRGSKTGSFAYMLLPSVLAPFCVVIGRHGAGFDAGEFPFSYILGEEGRSMLLPGVNLFKSGTVRDIEKWPKRDRRTSANRRDLIMHEPLSPYTIGLMLRGEHVLNELYERDEEMVYYRGLTIKRPMLRAGAKIYGGAIDAWLAKKMVEYSNRDSKPPANANAWADISGLLISRERIDLLEQAIENAAIESVEQFQNAIARAAALYAEDECAWVRKTYQARFGASIDIERLKREAAQWENALNQKVLLDAEKEFGEAARYGYGQDCEDPSADFEAVRGTFDENAFVKSIRKK